MCVRACEGRGAKTKKKKNSPKKIIFFVTVQYPVADYYCYPLLVISRAAVIAGGWAMSEMGVQVGAAEKDKSEK